jgi:hypothetical protein
MPIEIICWELLVNSDSAAQYWFRNGLYGYVLTVVSTNKKASGFRRKPLGIK